MAGLALVAILVLAAPLVAAGEVRGVYLAFLALVMVGSFEAVVPLGSAFGSLGRSVHAGERLFEVIDAEPEVVDPPEPLKAPCDVTLEFDRVSFCYGEGPASGSGGRELRLEAGEPGRCRGAERVR